MQQPTQQSRQQPVQQPTPDQHGAAISQTEPALVGEAHRQRDFRPKQQSPPSGNSETASTSHSNNHQAAPKFLKAHILPSDGNNLAASPPQTHTSPSAPPAEINPHPLPLRTHHSGNQGLPQLSGHSVPTPIVEQPRSQHPPATVEHQPVLPPRNPAILPKHSGNQNLNQTELHNIVLISQSPLMPEENSESSLRDCLPWSIMSLVLFCFLLGIPALILSVQVAKDVRAGKQFEAQQKWKAMVTLNSIAMCFFLCGLVAILCVIFVR